MKESYFQILEFILGIVFIAIGLLIFFRNQSKSFRDKRQNVNILSLMLGLGVGFLVFLFFPNSEAQVDKSELGLSIGGALGGIIIVWYISNKQGLKALVNDEEEYNATQMKEQLNALQTIIDNHKKEENPVKLSTEKKVYNIAGTKKSIGIYTGDILKIKDVDIWVNSENTNMEMARINDRSISSIIRYYGSRRNKYVRNDFEDVIANELRNELGDIKEVDPGVVVPTSGGALKESNNVKKLLHVASVRGQPGRGYKLVEDVQYCIINCLQEVDDLQVDEKLKTILFPTFGTSTAGASPIEITKKIITAARDYLLSHPKSSIETVFFLAYTENEEKCYQAVISSLDELDPA